MIHEFFCPTRIIVGVGAHARIVEVLKSLGSERIFIAVDAALLSSDIYARIKAALAESRIDVAAFSEIEPDPSDTTVAKAFEICRAHAATAIIALGGGSTIDVAKAVGIVSTNGGRIHDYEGSEVYATPPLPLIAIPTTAGTGSEVSGSCVISDTERHLKMSIRHARLNPAKVAILDPLALATMPASVAMHSGMDAFVHAIESYLSLNASPFTDALNLRAMSLIAGNIRPFVANRANTEAGLAMLSGSALTGMAFGQTGLGNVHCMARFVGAYFHLSHGLSNAVCLPHVARFNWIANPRKFAEVARAMGRDVGGLGENVAAQEAVAAIEALCRDLGVPARLGEIAGVSSDKFEEMARLCIEANYNRWNPRHTTQADFLALFQRAL